MEPSRCSARLCRSPAQSQSPITCLPLCSEHLKINQIEIAKSEQEVAKTLEHFKKYQKPLRLMQQRLASDLLVLDDTFHELREAIDHCQSRLTAAITKHFEEVKDSLSVLSELDDFQLELKAAKDSKDLRQAFVVNESMRMSLNGVNLSSTLAYIDDNDGEEVKLVPFPDTISPIKDLRACAEMQLEIASQLVEKIGTFEKSPDTKRVVRLSRGEKKKVEINGNVKAITACTNTHGLRLEETAEGLNVSETVIIAAVEIITTESDDSNKIYAVSADSTVLGTLARSWTVGQPIVDLHCDNDRQLLFIAQPNEVTVADLVGAQNSKKIGATDLHQDVKEILCLTGNSDKLFVLATTQDYEPKIFLVSKETHRLQQALPVPDSCELSLDASTRISSRYGFIFILDNDNVHQICSVTGLLILSVHVDVITDLDYILDEIDESKADTTLSEYYHSSNSLLRWSSFLSNSVATRHIVYSREGANFFQLMGIYDSDSSGEFQHVLYATDIALEVYAATMDPPYVDDEFIETDEPTEEYGEDYYD